MAETDYHGSDMDEANYSWYNYESYNYDYEYSSLTHMPAWAIPFIFFAYVLFVAFNVLLIVVILSTVELRQRPGNWLIVNLAVCLAIGGLLFVSTSGVFIIPNYKHSPGLCEVVQIIYCMISLLIPMNVLMITVEHYVSIVKTGGSESGFSKGATIGCIVGMAVGVTIFTLIMVYGIGNGFIFYGNLCYMNESSVIIPSIAMILIFLTTIVMTAIVIAQWHRSDKGDTKKVALPLVVTNTFFLIIEIPLIISSMAYYGGFFSVQFHVALWYLSEGLGIILPILWLVSSPSIRQAYRKTCCPCCPGEGDEAEKIHLLEAK